MAGKRSLPSHELIERQTGNLQELVEMSRRVRATPDSVKTTHETQEETVVLRAIRCPRCGSAVYPLFPVPTLCGDCAGELLARDRHDAPGCRWWGQLLQRFQPPRPPGDGQS